MDKAGDTGPPASLANAAKRMNVARDTRLIRGCRNGVMNKKKVAHCKTLGTADQLEAGWVMIAPYQNHFDGKPGQPFPEERIQR